MSATIQRIAALRHETVDEAILFCKQVQSLCRIGTPKYGDIEECLRQHPDLMHDARAIARRVIPVKGIPRHYPGSRPKKTSSKQVNLNPMDRERAKREWLYGDWTTD